MTYLLKKFITDWKPIGRVDMVHELQAMQQARRDFVHIRDDAHAWEIILYYIDNVIGCTAGIDDDTFAAHPEMQAMTERAVQVIARLYGVLSPAEREKFNRSHLFEIRQVAMDLDDIGQPPARQEIWRICSVILPELQQILAGKDRHGKFTSAIQTTKKG